MKEEILARLEDETQTVFQTVELPPAVGTFRLSKTFRADDNTVEIFNYDSRERHCKIIAYFDGATSEYKIRIQLGLNEWCLSRFFESGFERFIGTFRAALDGVIATFDHADVKKNFFIEELKLSEWSYGKNLPSTINGLELFISPSRPIETTNGSFIVINYVDFERARDLVVYYNIFSDEFSAETRDGAHTHVIYELDAKTLVDLEKNLTAYFSAGNEK